MPEPPCMAGVQALAPDAGPCFLAALPGPPGGQQHHEPGLLQRSGLAFQEPVGLPCVQPVTPAGCFPFRLSLMTGQIEPALGQGAEQELGGVEVPGDGPLT